MLYFKNIFISKFVNYYIHHKSNQILLNIISHSKLLEILVDIFNIIKSNLLPFINYIINKIYN